MKLYDYFRSSCAYRVRIALNLKGLPYGSVPVNLVNGEQQDAAYRKLNPQGLVPALSDDGTLITQSLAICEYLDDTHPEPPLLPQGATARARVRALAYVIACEIHPLDNLRVLKYLTGQLRVSEDTKLTWYRHWINEGFAALETTLAESTETGRFCHGDAPGLADACLVPQVFNAKRFGVELAAFPTIRRINDNCLGLVAFQRARPENQMDAR